MPLVDLKLLVTGGLLAGLALLLVQAEARTLGPGGVNPGNLRALMPRLARSGPMRGAICCAGLGGVAGVLAVRLADLPVADPVLFLGYAVSAIALWWITRDDGNLLRVAGMVMIAIGVWLTAG